MEFNSGFKGLNTTFSNLGLLHDRIVGLKHMHAKHAHTQCICERTHAEWGHIILQIQVKNEHFW